MARRVLIQGLTSSRGGVETYVKAIYDLAVSRGYQVDFLVSEKTVVFEDELRERGSQFWYVSEHDLSVARYALQVRRVFKEESYDIFWSNRTNLSTSIVFLVAKLAGGVTTICHAHASGILNWGRKALIKHHLLRPLVHPFIDIQLACSQGARRWFYPRSNRARVINNSIDLDLFQFDAQTRAQLRSELGLNGEFVIGHVGRLCEVKNQSFLLDILYELVNRGVNSKLVFCGSGPDLQQLTDRADILNLSDRVIFAGVRDDISRVMTAFDVFAFPSISEGLPFALVEAQASGLPCLVSDRVGAEAQVGSLYFKLPIGNGVEPWVETMMALPREIDRYRNVTALRESGFDRSTQNEVIGDIFDEALKLQPVKLPFTCRRLGR